LLEHVILVYSMLGRFVNRVKLLPKFVLLYTELSPTATTIEPSEDDANELQRDTGGEGFVAATQFDPEFELVKIPAGLLLPATKYCPSQDDVTLVQLRLMSRGFQVRPESALVRIRLFSATATRLFPSAEEAMPCQGAVPEFVRASHVTPLSVLVYIKSLNTVTANFAPFEEDAPLPQERFPADVRRVQVAPESALVNIWLLNTLDTPLPLATTTVPSKDDVSNPQVPAPAFERVVNVFPESVEYAKK
jgi:hypothetical protein